MAAHQPSLQVRHMDLPDIRETFADSIHSMVWDGQTLRVEFCVTRFPDPAAQTEATRYPACRLVLSALAATDLANRLQQTAAALKDSAAGQPKAQPGQQSNQSSAAEKPAI